MNPYTIAASALILAATHALVGWRAFSAGEDKQIAAQAKTAELVKQAQDAAMKGAADAIKQARIENVRVVTSVQTVTRTVPVYRECRHDDRVFNDINGALAGKPAR